MYKKLPSYIFHIALPTDHKIDLDFVSKCFTDISENKPSLFFYVCTQADFNLEEVILAICPVLVF